MNRACYSLWAIAAILLLSAAGRGADLTLLNGDVNLTISSATAGQQPDQASDEGCMLRWTTLLADPVKKIVASSNLAGPRFSISLRATNVNPGHGTSAGSFVLGTIASDLVVSIPPNLTAGDPGQCNLRYTASATAASGTGSDSHTVTFTITDQ